MGYFSELKIFRDMDKKPDEYGIHIDEETKKEIEAENKLNSEATERGESKKKIERLGPTAANYRQVIDAVADFSLKTGCSENDPENHILSERKKTVLSLLRQIISDVERYVFIVNNFNIIYNSRNENKDGYIEDMHAVDSERRIIHNRMISDLKILIRAMNMNFNADVDPQIRFEAERKMPDRKDLSDTELKEALEKRDYIHFAKKNFLMESLPQDPQGERDYIKEWSFALYNDLTNLNDDLQEALNKKDLD